MHYEFLRSGNYVHYVYYHYYKVQPLECEYNNL